MNEPDVIHPDPLEQLLANATERERKAIVILLNYASELKRIGRGLPSMHCSRNDHVSLMELAKATGSHPDAFKCPALTAVISHLAPELGIECRPPRRRASWR